MNISVKHLDNSEVEIEGEIPADIFDPYHKRAVQKFQKEIVVDGFRKGNVPENILLEKVGAGAVLEAAAEERTNMKTSGDFVDMPRRRVIVSPIIVENPIASSIKAISFTALPVFIPINIAQTLC